MSETRSTPEEFEKTEQRLMQQWRDEKAAKDAYARADAWARSAKGTPYGATTPTAEVIDLSKVPDALDPRVMARLHGREAKQ